MDEWHQYFLTNMNTFYDELESQTEIDLYFYVNNFLEGMMNSLENKDSFILVEEFIDSLDIDNTLNSKLINHIFIILNVITSMAIQYGKFNIILKINNFVKNYKTYNPYKLVDNNQIKEIQDSIDNYMDSHIENFV